MRLTHLSLAAAVSFAVAISGVVNAQEHRETAISSLVRVQCLFDDGSQMSSTGFAWFDAMHVVAALHAVAGCKDRLVHKEGGSQIPATIVRASRIADLAYLRLDEDIGLKPVDVVSDLATTDGDFYTWGYPHGLYLSSKQVTKLDGGLKDEPIPLGQAFRGVSQIKSLFETQDYPRADTLVLRVSTPLQPGQSGAPIIDREGRVVAIADGGLLEGFRGINWSIPAFIYLDGLLASDDPVPTERSAWAALYSKVTPVVPSPDGGITVPTSRIDGVNANLQLVRNIKLADFEDILKSKDETDDFFEDASEYLEDIEEIRRILSRDEFAHLSFDVYEDQITGATLGVPAGLPGEWDDETGLLYVETAGPGEAGMIIGYSVYDSFNQSLTEGTEHFLKEVASWLNWAEGTSAISDISVRASAPQRESEQAYFYFDDLRITYARERYPYQVFLSLDVWENELLGYAVFGPKNTEDLTEPDYVDFLMMEMSAVFLSGFAEF